jgi:leucyl aminopeptidase
VPVFDSGGSPVAGAAAHRAARGSALDLPAVLRAHPHAARAGEVTPVPFAADAPVLLLVGVGSGGRAELRLAAAAATRAARGHEVLVSVLAAERSAADVRAVAEASVLGGYAFGETSGRGDSAAGGKPGRVILLVDQPAQFREVVAQAEVVSRASWLARDLANTPALTKSPEWLAETAAATARGAGLRVRVRGAAELAAEGFGGLLGVGAGSARPPFLVEIGYAPERPGARHVVLAGKGITFDSGGLSLKSAEAMTGMKTDMSGAAAVLAAVAALAELGCAHRVTGLLALAENLPSGSALRPGDVIHHYGGRSVEVLNTDAEGRLVLADALAYADAKLAPDVLVDLATLTGAATQGLGRTHGALYASTDALADELVAAGAQSGERLWRMPLVEDYRDALEAEIADLRNIADPARGYGAGSITAALFLREFTGGRAWAHLDIAGPARSESRNGELTKGATGFGARLLAYWLAGLAGESSAAR